MIAGQDPGHGGPRSRGACHNDIVEADWNLCMARQMSTHLIRSGSPWEPRLLRSSDVDVSFPERAQIASQERCDVVLHWHVNANTDPTVHGLTTYHWPGNPVGKAIGDVICRAAPAPLYRKGQRSIAATDEPGTHDDWKQKPRSVMEYIHCTSILVEVGFCSNEIDAEALQDQKVQLGIVHAAEVGLVVGWQMLEVT